MNLNDRLDRVREEVADEVASDVRVPSFDDVLVRRARRRRFRAAVGGAALAVVVAGSVGGIAATRPDASRSVPPAATLSANPPTTPSTAPPSSALPTTAPSSAQTYPAKGSSYVVVPDGDQLAWTDLKTGAHGHFGPADGSQLSEPSVSADGRRIAFLHATTATSPPHISIGYWDLDTRSGGTTAAFTGPTTGVTPSISPDGTRVALAWFGRGIQISSIGEAKAPTTIPTTDGSKVVGVAWAGNDAVAYLPADAQTGGDCAVERVTLSTSQTRCLLPIATLRELPAPNGAVWTVATVTGSGDSNLLALDVNAQAETGPTLQAVAILDPAAEATPFHVLTSTFATQQNYEAPTFPNLVAAGSRVVYVERTGVNPDQASGTVLVASVAGGKPTRITIGGVLGLGATSG